MTRAASGVALNPVEPKQDVEGDSDNLAGSYYDGDDEDIRAFGHAASAADQRAIAGLVKRYYAAAAVADGVAACRLLYPVLAEAVPEEYGQGPALRGDTCAAVMFKLFKQRHGQVSAERATLAVGAVRVEGEHGFVMLGPRGTMPRRYLAVRSERGAWRMNVLLDASLP